MRAIGYVRVSTAEQAKEGVSLESQAAEIRRYAAARGWVLVDIARDDGVSGSVPLAHRKGGEALMRALETADADAVIVTKLDRAFRDAADCLNVTKAWDEAGIPLAIITLGVDTSTPMGRMFLTMTAAFAELERAQIGERTRDAMAEVKRQGGEVGRAPFGWRYGTEKDARGRRVKVQVPEQQATIRRIVDLYRGGESLRTIAAVLQREGRRPARGNLWHPATVGRIVEAALVDVRQATEAKREQMTTVAAKVPR